MALPCEKSKFMAYIKIFSDEELDTDMFSMDLRFDYKRDDPDSVFYPEPTFEYFYDIDSELDDNEWTEIQYDSAYETFIENIHFLYGILDAAGIKYDYDILDAQYKDIENIHYRKGFNSIPCN